MSIWSFLDYREFVRAWLAAHPRISLRTVARRMGCSASLLSRILAGERELDPTRVAALASALKLEPDAAEYLADLVELESPALARRQAAMTRIAVARRFAAAGEVKDDAVRLFARWEYGAIWQLARCAGFQADPEWIRSRLRPELPLVVIADALEALEALGVLLRDADGRLTPVAGDRITPPQVPPGIVSEAVREWHRSHLHNLEAALELPSNERYLTGITLAVSPEALDRIRERAVAFTREVAAIAAETADPERVVQLQVGLFPLTRSSPTGGAPPTSSNPTPGRTA